MDTQGENDVTTRSDYLTLENDETDSRASEAPSGVKDEIGSDIEGDVGAAEEGESTPSENDNEPEAAGETGGDAMRTSPEGSPSHSPGGTPVVKRVQFEEDGEEVIDQKPDSDDGYQEPVDRISQEDNDLDTGGEDEREEEPQPSTSPVIAETEVNTPVAPRSESEKNLIRIPRSSSDVTPVMSDGMRCRWGCCCGLGWFMVGVVALVVGTVLVVYKKKYWKSSDNAQDSTLLYFGIGYCIFGALTVIIGLSFWTCAYIVCPRSRTDRSPEEQMNGVDPGRSRKTKYVINANKVISGPAVAMPHDHVTSEKNEANHRDSNNTGSEGKTQNTSTDAVRDDTFLV